MTETEKQQMYNKIEMMKEVTAILEDLATTEELDEPDVKSDGKLSAWGWLARIARVRKKRVTVVDSRVLSGFFVDVGSEDGRMYGLFAQDGCMHGVRVYYDEIISITFGGVLSAPIATREEDETPLSEQVWTWDYIRDLSVEGNPLKIWRISDSKGDEIAQTNTSKMLDIILGIPRLVKAAKSGHRGFVLQNELKDALEAMGVV